MNYSLTNLRNLATKKAVILLGCFLIVAFGFIIISVLLRRLSPQEKVDYTPITTQPVIDGKFNEQADISQKSKTSLEKISSKLPHRETISTSTGNQVKIMLYKKDKDNFIKKMSELGCINIPLKIQRLNTMGEI